MSCERVVIKEKEYPVTYRQDKTFVYTKATIQGALVEGYGKDTETAYWSL